MSCNRKCNYGIKQVFLYLKCSFILVQGDLNLHFRPRIWKVFPLAIRKPYMYNHHTSLTALSILNIPSILPKRWWILVYIWWTCHLEIKMGFFPLPQATVYNLVFAYQLGHTAPCHSTQKFCLMMDIWELQMLTFLNKKNNNTKQNIQ